MFFLLSWVLFIASTSIICGALNLTQNKLYAPDIYVKILSGAMNGSALEAGLFPHYTTQDSGRWEWFSLASSDGWPSGFFPSMMYLLNERQSACNGLAPVANWLGLGRYWSAPLLNLQMSNTIQSSIGMASFPFQDELKA